MAEFTIYKVGLTGTVLIKADTEQEAKNEALAYFAQAPQSYVVILEVTNVIEPEP